MSQIKENPAPVAAGCEAQEVSNLPANDSTPPIRFVDYLWIICGLGLITGCASAPDPVEPSPLDLCFQGDKSDFYIVSEQFSGEKTQALIDQLFIPAGSRLDAGNTVITYWDLGNPRFCLGRRCYLLRNVPNCSNSATSR